MSPPPKQLKNRMMIDINKSLEELENNRWMDVKEYPSPLIAKIHGYRKKPIKLLTIEELRLLIGQNIGLYFIVPVAIEVLKENVFAEGDFFPGDLLLNVLRIDVNYWKENPSEKGKLNPIIGEAEKKIVLEDYLPIQERIREAIRKYKGNE